MQNVAMVKTIAVAEQLKYTVRSQRLTDCKTQCSSTKLGFLSLLKSYQFHNITLHLLTRQCLSLLHLANEGVCK